MLFKLSLKNITKSVKDYAIYFFTLILGVAIFYLFNSLDSQTAMLNVSNSTHQLITLMNQMLSGVSVFVSFVLGFLIIYASRFLMKRRNKEFGIYMTLGMGKGKISRILLFETLMIGIISLFVGLGIGIVLSQGMSVFVASMFEADMSKFTFVFSASALGKTIVYFGIMYVIVMLLNTVQIGRCKLIDLLQANKKTEKVKIKNPYLCTIVFIVACCMLGYAYYCVTAGVNNLIDTSDVLFPIALGIISTFLIFWSLSGLVLRMITSWKKVYYKGLNSFILRQINSKINTTVCSMSVICLMLFLTICILSSALSMKNAMSANLTELAPIDVEFSKRLDEVTTDFPVEKANGYQASIEENLASLGFSTGKRLKDTVHFYTYTQESLTFGATLGDYKEQVLKEYPSLMVDVLEQVVRISDYNKLARLYGTDTYELADDEYMIIADFDSMVAIRNEAFEYVDTLQIGGKEYHAKYHECKPGFIGMSANHINTGIILVPDQAVETLSKVTEQLSANYNADTDEGKQAIENEIVAFEDNPIVYNTNLDAVTKISIYEASIGLGAIVTFIGLYLGIIFLISSAAILALKELSESSDNQERYGMLRKLGVDDKMINRALFIQIAIFFLFPLILAIIHSCFGLQTASYILETFGHEKLLLSIVMTAIFLIFIYGGYFVITYLCSKRIIKER